MFGCVKSYSDDNPEKNAIDYYIKKLSVSNNLSMKKIEASKDIINLVEDIY